MERIRKIIDKWGDVMLCAGIVVLLFCALVTCVTCWLNGVYVFFGICGIVGLVPAILLFIESLFHEIKKRKEA